MSTEAVSKAKSHESERCNGCGKLLFKVYRGDSGYVFVEIKCGGCNRIVIRKFKEAEKTEGGCTHDPA